MCISIFLKGRTIIQLLLHGWNQEEIGEGMDPQAQLNILTERLRVMQETNAQLVQLIANQYASVHDETKFFKRLATHMPKTYDVATDPVVLED